MIISPTIPQDFFTKAVREVAAQVDLTKGQDVLDERNPVVERAVRSAYTDILANTATEFHKEARVERYENAGYMFILRVRPVLGPADPDNPQAGEAPLIKVYAGEDEDELEYGADKDFTVKRGFLKLGSGTLEEFNRGISVLGSSTEIITVEYTAGLLKAEENDFLFDALVEQGVANYNRRDNRGLASMSRTDTLIRVASDAGGLLDSVKDKIQPLRYHGQGYRVE